MSELMMSSNSPQQPSTILDAERRTWRPVFWEPVTGTGERLLVGILYQFDDMIAAARFLRDDVLDGLFGKQARGASKLIDFSLGMLQGAARADGSVRTMNAPLMGLYPGEVRATGARTIPELLRTAALLHSSLTNLEKLDELEEGDAPLPEEINRRFGTEVREWTLAKRPDLINYFGRSAMLVEGGQLVRFGFCSPKLVAHFNVFHPSRPSASLRDARARLFELQGAKNLASIPDAVLIGAVSRDDDATLGDRLRLQLAEVRTEIGYEAEANGVHYRPVHNAEEGSSALLDLAA